MATFPAIIPTTRLYTQGDFPSAIQASSSGATTGNGPGDFSHKIEVNSDDADGQSVSNYEYEQRYKTKKGKLNCLTRHI